MEENNHGSQYSPTVACIYVFNLVVGTGILALPSVLVTGGWFLGGLFLVLVSFCSFVTVTFMLEAMATANALIRLENKNGIEEHTLLAIEASEMLLEDGTPNDESHALQQQSDRQLFQIAKRTELGEMAGLFFNQWGIIFFYTALILYLFGDSVIYSTMVARSLVGFFSGPTPAPWTFDMYLVLFVVFSVPLCFFDFQKTKLLQIMTMAIRNICLYTMIILAIVTLAKSGRHDKEVPHFNVLALPNLFGGTVYSFMCHHSLPSIVTPMRDKSRVLRIVGMAFMSVIVVYLFLFISCGLAFGTGVLDPITFNFPPQQYGIIGDVLFLFPVFTLSSNFPMLSITLRNNFDTLFQLLLRKARNAPHFETVARSPQQVARAAGRRRILLTLLAVLPPTFFSYIAEHSNMSVDELVGITGAFAGCAVMFIIPATMVYCSRKVFAKVYMDMLDEKKTVLKPLPLPKNVHASPFSGQCWVFVILIWAVLAILFNAFENWTNHSTQ
ncbi:unnamed protein product [Sphagnum jensenii]|uniref:Amino acid transporter transmembrane domain-containing protein n=1 Tax=Sphagnum jensenii TaxID=128206 RepID=A0ABP1BYV4_9BRYO